MSCNACKETKEVYECDGCHSTFCKACGKLSSSEIRVLQQRRVMKFFCQGCSESDRCILFREIIESKEHIISDKEEIIELLKREISTLKNKIDDDQKSMSFSEVVRNGNKKKDVEPENILIVKPSTAGKTITRQDLIEKNVCPDAISVGVKECKKSKSGGVVIKCARKEDVEIIKRDIETKMGNEVITNVPQLKKPCIKIVGIDPDLAEEGKIIDCIWRQNTIVGERSDVEIVVIKKMRTKYMAIMRCSPEIHEAVLKLDKMYIGWKSVLIFDYVQVTRCYKCGGFNHFAEKCKFENICLNCGGDHKTNVCKSGSHKCRNCLESNKNLGTEYDINHNIFHVECPIYLKNVEVQKKWIKYKVQ